jgi:V-type H+-transporting ATPase subunit H
MFFFPYHFHNNLECHASMVFIYSSCYHGLGVVMHYAIQKLYEVISTLMERKERSQVSMMNTFYSSDGKLVDDWRPLLRILHLGNGGDPFAQCGASLCLAYILLVGCPSRQSQSFRIDYSTVREPLQALLSWISSQLQSSSGSSVSLVTPTLMALIDCKEARHMFAASGGIGYLSKHLKRKHGGDVSRRKRNDVSVQQLYELTFALWTTSYELNSTYSIRAAFADMGAVKALCDLVASAPREKVVRVALSSLCNLAQCKPDYSEAVEIKRRIDGSVFLDDMIACGLTKSVDLLKQRRWTDEDLLEGMLFDFETFHKLLKIASHYVSNMKIDLKFLSKMLHDSYHEMSRWELYEHEILSGNLEWGILHNEKFFRQNAKHFEGENSDFPLLRKLILLASLDDEDVACVACFDLGEFARHYPNGRSILNRLGAKEVVMRLIESENEQLSHQALQAVSKMMVVNWDAVK